MTSLTKIADPDVSAALLGAVRRVNAVYQAVPETGRPDVGEEDWQKLERALDRANAVGDHASALAAIDNWELAAKAALPPAPEVAT